MPNRICARRSSLSQDGVRICAERTYCADPLPLPFPLEAPELVLVDPLLLELVPRAR
jgi:hypothetical protein